MSLEPLTMSHANSCLMGIALDYFIPGVQRVAGFLDWRFMRRSACRKDAVKEL